MDFLSRAWCNFAVQTLQPDHNDHHQLVVQDQSMALLDKQMIIKKIETSPYMVSPMAINILNELIISMNLFFLLLSFFFFLSNKCYDKL